MNIDTQIIEDESNHMRTLIEIAKECGGAVNGGELTSWTIRKGAFYFEDAEQLQDTFDDYCKQFEPIYQCRLVGNAWADIRLSEYKRRPNFEYRIVYPQQQQIPSEVKEHNTRELVNSLTKIAKDYAHTQQLRERISSCVNDALSGKQQIPSEVKTYIERLESALDEALEEQTLASKPTCLKD